MPQKLAIYIHWPFCKSKCPYCDFNSYAIKDFDSDEFQKAYIQELHYFKNKIQNREISSIFFGGGTPSIMNMSTVKAIINEIDKLWGIPKSTEISMEANPTSMEIEKLQDFKAAGINRISLGIQSLYDEDLRFLGRQHNAFEAKEAIKAAAKIFGDRYSIDLIYTRPKQNLQNWQTELGEALKLSPYHISLYQLTIEEGTRFYKQEQSGDFAMPDGERSIDFYNLTREITEQHGIPAYEVSNYAQAGYECKHNITYWKSGDYLGIGAGAHSRVYFDGDPQRKAIAMTKKPALWLELLNSKGAGIEEQTNLTEEERAEEFLMMGLRMTEGISNAETQASFGKNIDELWDNERIDYLAKNGLLEFDGNRLKATRDGLLVLNAVIEELV